MLLKTAIELAPEGMSIEEGEIGALPLYNADLHQSGLPPEICGSASGPPPPMRCSS